MKTKAFTLIELLVASAIIMIITGFGLAGWTRFREKALINSVADQLRTELRLVRSRAINGEKPSTDCETLDGYMVRESGGNLEVVVCCDGSCSSVVETIQISDQIEDKSFSNFPVTFLSLSGVAEISGGESQATIELIYHDLTWIITISSSGEIE